MPEEVQAQQGQQPEEEQQQPPARPNVRRLVTTLLSKTLTDGIGDTPSALERWNPSLGEDDVVSPDSPHPSSLSLLSSSPLRPSKNGAGDRRQEQQQKQQARQQQTQLRPQMAGSQQQSSRSSSSSRPDSGWRKFLRYFSPSYVWSRPPALRPCHSVIYPALTLGGLPFWKFPRCPTPRSCCTCPLYLKIHVC